MKKLLLIVIISIFNTAAFSQIDKLTFTNTQSVNAGPETYQSELKVESKLNGAIQVPGGGNRSGLITIAPWSFLGIDPTNSQLAFNKSQIYFRHSNSDGVSWSDWKKILLDDDEFNYLKFVNTQSVNTPPSGYSEDFKLEQKLSGAIGLGGSNRTGLLTIAPWPSDGNDVPDTQLGFTKGKIYQRSGLADGSGWGNWEKILTANDAELALDISDEIFVSKIGINTENIPEGYNMAINGKGIMEEVKVSLVENWPDFIFASDYKLQPLETVEAFINENQHLPEIPSEAEVLEEGINLGEMDAKLLQKIEELTLHMIEMNKRVKQLEEENQKLKENQGK